MVLSAILFGSVVSGLYSAAGAILSLLGMALLKKSGFFGTVGVSVSGAVLHNLGQIGIACFILKTQALVYYLPFLILSAVLSGVVIGIISAVLVERLGGEEYGRRAEK